jgi:uncharacterized membrane protein
VLHGSDDPLVSPQAGQDTAAHIKGAELRIIEGMGHDFPPSLFGLVAAAIADNAGHMFKPVNRRDASEPLLPKATMNRSKRAHDLHAAM